MANLDFGRIKRYFWDLLEQEPSNDDTTGAPVWLLGRQYDVSPKKDRKEITTNKSTPPNASLATHPSPPVPAETAMEDSGVLLDKPDDDGGGWGTEFLDDFESRIWMTYRTHFPPIPTTPAPSLPRVARPDTAAGFTSDTGWGCMIRTGQSLLANALVMIRFGRDWRRGEHGEQERALLALFADDPAAPYSIHKFVEHGAAACGKHPGEWFGPSATARCIEALSNRRADMRVYITGDGPDVYEDAFMRIARPDGHSFQPTLVLVGTRLGIDTVNPVYWRALQSTLQMPQSLGIAGGRPSSSHYFLGTQGAHLFYLDPHHARPALPRLEALAAADVASCHTRRLRRLHIREMDPSMLIAFVIRDEADWRAWRARVAGVAGTAVIHVADEAPARDVAREGAVAEVESCDEEDEGIGSV